MLNNSRLPLAVAIFTLVAVGCGGPKMVPISGKVLYKDGTPIEGGLRAISFQPKDDSDAEVIRPAGSPIGSDGSFELRTKRPGDGVYVGQYHVTIAAVADGVTGRPIIPQKYNFTGESPFEFDVSEARDDLLFEIDRLGEESEDE